MLMIIVSPSVTSTSTSPCATPRSTAPCSSASTAGLVSARGLISCAPSSVSAVRSVIGSPRSRRFLELHRNATDRVVLAKGVALPVVGHEDPRQVGVPFEHDPEHVVDLALHGLGAREELEQRRQGRLVFGHLRSHAHSLAFVHRKEAD